MTAEAATAVIELLMMGGKTPEKCRAVNKRQDNKAGKLLHLVGDLLKLLFIKVGHESETLTVITRNPAP
jgi:hypothetical protein